MSRERYLQRKYGISEAQYEALLELYDGGCWVCGKKPKPGGRRLHVDHDHKTGRVRGLLCWRHNTGLRHFGDDAILLNAAARYVASKEAQLVLEKED